MSEGDRAKMRFCPACGEKLPEGVSAKFCLFCGAKLPVSASEQPVQKDALATMAQGAAVPTVIQEELDALRTATIIEVVRKTPVEKPAAEDGAADYSVIIKKVIDPVRLTEALLTYLTRGGKAIRMAVDMAPSVLVYKSKKADVERILPVLTAERACYTVVKGDFEQMPSARRVLPGFLMLPPLTQEALTGAPAGLWIGESAQTVLPDLYFDGETGCLVVTDRHLYFLPHECKTRDELYSMWLLADIIDQDLWQEQEWHHVDVGLRNQEKLHFSFRQLETACRFKRALEEAAKKRSR